MVAQPRAIHRSRGQQRLDRGDARVVHRRADGRPDENKVGSGRGDAAVSVERQSGCLHRAQALALRI